MSEPHDEPRLCHNCGFRWTGRSTERRIVHCPRCAAVLFLIPTPS